MRNNMNPPQIKALDWEDEDEELYRVLYPLMRGAGVAGAQGALDGLADIGVGVDWGLVNQAVVEWAKGYTFELVKQINGTTRKFLQVEVSEWIESGAPLESLIDGLAPMFGKVRADMIAATEVTRAFAEGNDATWRASGVVEEFDVMTGEDDLVCPICLEKVEQNPWKIGNSEGQMPFHVKCRCWKRPIVKV